MAVKSGAFDDAGTHLVNEVKHLVFIAILIFIHTVKFKGFWGTTATLVEGCDKALAIFHLFELFFFHSVLLFKR